MIDTSTAAGVIEVRIHELAQLTEITACRPETPSNASYLKVLRASCAEEPIMRLRLILCAAVACAAMTHDVSAQIAPPDAMVGRALAGRLCSGCHAVDPSGTGGVRGDVPSFAAIARTPNITAERLAGAIIMPHPAMPGIPLTRAEIRDVIAYIVSLKP